MPRTRARWRCSPTRTARAWPRTAGCPCSWSADPRARLGEVASWIYGDPSGRLMLIGVTGTSGKTTTTYLLESGLRMAGHLTGLVGGVETRVAGEVRPQPAHHPGGHRPAGAAGRHGAARGDRGRHGGVQPRAGPGPGRRHQLRGGRLHQPVPGPPGLPRRHDGLLRGQGQPVHPGLRADRGGQHRRPAGPQADRRAADPADHVLRGGPGRGRLARHRRAQRRRREHLPGDRPRRRGRRRVGRAARAVQRGQRARRHRRAGRGRGRPGRRGGRGRRLPGGARPPGAGGPRPGLHRAGGLLAQARRGRGGAARAPAGHRRASCPSCWAAAATGTGPSAR